MSYHSPNLLPNLCSGRVLVEVLAEFGLDFTGKDSCVYSFARYLIELCDRPITAIFKKNVCKS
jgi:hypothetical protein